MPLKKYAEIHKCGVELNKIETMKQLGDNFISCLLRSGYTSESPRFN